MFVQHLQPKFKMDDMMPTVVNVELEGNDPPETKVVCFYFKETFKFLLFDEESMYPENLMINSGNPSPTMCLFMD